MGGWVSGVTGGAGMDVWWWPKQSKHITTPYSWWKNNHKKKKLNKHELLINGFEWKTERATVNLVTLLGMYMGMEVGSFLGGKCARKNQ